MILIFSHQISMSMFGWKISIFDMEISTIFVDEESIVVLSFYGQELTVECDGQMGFQLGS